MIVMEYILRIFTVQLGSPVLSFFLLLMTVSYTQAQVPSQENANGGANTCLVCHNQPPVTHILQTPHAPLSLNNCQSCHGPSTDHTRQMNSPDIVFGENTGRFPASDVQVQNQACLNCHGSGSRFNWHGSQHDFADLSCSSCHTIHAMGDPVLLKIEESQVCFGCHQDKRAQINRRSHHPVEEGKVACSDCHNSHGSPGVSLLLNNTVNETCYQCHAEKRGPFLWEHQPVREDCSNCHNPHGSNQQSLLNVRTPFLCQQCHQEAFHPSSLYSATGIPPGGAAQQLLGKDCMNCHSTIHGSNHPSGSRLTR